MTHRLPPLILAATALAATGCGGSKHASTTSSAAPSGAKAPYGLYVRMVTKHDIARTAKLRDEHGPNQSAPGPGRYRLVIARGAVQDVIKVTGPDGFTIDMDMTVKPGALRMVSYVDPNRASFCGPEVPEQATYSFHAAGASLQLRPQGDPCADRDSTLTGTWAKG
jgi:hypothetical protein